MSGHAPVRVLLLVAVLNIGSHLAGLVAAILWMRPGTPLVSLEARMAFLARHPLGWSLGWATWMLCALSLLAFLAVLREHAGVASLASLSVTMAAAGAGVDLLCDTLQILVLPNVASRRDTALYVACERGLDAGGLVPANGLYSVGILLAALALRPRLPAHSLGLGVATFGGGMLMVAAGFTGDPQQLQLSSGLTMGAFLLWSVDVTRALLRPEHG